MPVIRSGDDRGVSPAFMDKVTEISVKAFQVALIPTIFLTGWLLWGLLSGRFADTAGKAATQREVLQTVQALSYWLNISLVVLVISGIIAFYEEVAFGYTLLTTAAILIFGLPYIADFLGQSSLMSSNSGASAAALREIHIAALIIGIPAILLVIRNIVVNLLDSRKRQDLTSVTYGKNVAEQDDVPRAPFKAFANCWQLPFCRAGVRKQCAIYHARTKCWKQGVGCMCEENLIRLVGMTNHKEGKTPPPTANVPSDGGFVPIGDIIQRSEAEVNKDVKVQTKAGPRGVRIPVNPHLTPAQIRNRCHNCIIYNEHQRQKYQFFAPVITLAVPALIYINFESLRNLIQKFIQFVGSLVGRLTLTSEASSSFVSAATGSITVEMALVVCITLVVVTWALRFLEYLTFKLKV